MIKILVDSYPKSKLSCPFYIQSNGTCMLKEKIIGNEFGCKWVHEYCEAFYDNLTFDKEKCGMLKYIK